MINIRVIEPSFEIVSPIDGEEILRHIELCGRVCYKSEEKMTPDSAKKFVANVIKRGHESVLEHASLTVRFICDRGVSHELVRHRLASFSQESTRYCNYVDDKFNNELTFIRPFMLESLSYYDYYCWQDACFISEWVYFRMIESGRSAQEARSVLPNSIKTEVVMTANLREWRHFFKLRTAPDAHPQMRQLTIPLLRELQGKIPIVFDDIEVK